MGAVKLVKNHIINTFIFVKEYEFIKFFVFIYASDFLTYCQNEYTTKLKIREEQVEGRRLRLEEKNAVLEKMENPPVLVPTKPERKGKQQKKPERIQGAKRPEQEQESEQLSYLPTPDEIILQREGTVLNRVVPKNMSLIHSLKF